MKLLNQVLQASLAHNMSHSSDECGARADFDAAARCKLCSSEWYYHNQGSESWLQHVYYLDGNWGQKMVLRG